MKLTSRLTGFMVLMVVVSFCLLLIAGSNALIRLARSQQQAQLQNLVEVIDQQLLANPEHIQQWLPPLLRAHQVVRIELSDGRNIRYSFRDPSNATPLDDEIYYRWQLPDGQGIADVTAARPFYRVTLETWDVVGILLALSMIGGLLWGGVLWLKRHLRAAEQLETRASQLLAGKLVRYQDSAADEWPHQAGLALSYLTKALLDARKERSRFDTLIRANAFVDQRSRLPNRQAFANRLQVALHDRSLLMGAVILVQLARIGSINQRFGKAVSDELIDEVARIVSHFQQQYYDSMAARISGTQFTLLLSNVTVAETEQAASQICKKLHQMRLPEGESIDEFYYVGAVNFTGEDQVDSLLDDAEHAARVAQLRGPSSWYMFENTRQWPNVEKGSVRWRGFFERVLAEEAVVPFVQPVLAAQTEQFFQHELLLRIADEQGDWLTAGRLLPLAAKVGMEVKLDRAMTLHALNWLKQIRRYEGELALNLTAATLADKPFFGWFRMELMQLPKPTLSRFVIEFKEEYLVNATAVQSEHLRLLIALGVRLSVDHAGEEVISTQLIKDYQVSYLKLHPSLVVNIHLQPINQLAVRSLVGACADTNTKVIAEGVEDEDDAQCLAELGVFGLQGFLLSVPERLNKPQMRRAARKKRVGNANTP